MRSTIIKTPEELVERYYADIYRYIFWRVKNYAAAEDATQETFLRATRHINSICQATNQRAFLYKIATNLCIDLSRHKTNEALPKEISYAEAGFENIEAQDSFKRLINILPKDQQMLALLRFGHQLKIREIADILKLPLRTVQSRLRSALKKLKAEIGGQT